MPPDETHVHACRRETSTRAAMLLLLANWHMSDMSLGCFRALLLLLP